MHSGQLIAHYKYIIKSWIFESYTFSIILKSKVNYLLDSNEILIKNITRIYNNCNNSCK